MATASCWTDHNIAIKTVVQRRCFDKYCATRDGYRAKAFKPPRWTDCTGPWAGRLYGTNKSQSVNVGTTCTKIIYGMHLHEENQAKMGASPMDCVCKLCGGVDSQHHIIRDCTHRKTAACRDKHVEALERYCSQPVSGGPVLRGLPGLRLSGRRGLWCVHSLDGHPRPPTDHSTGGGPACLRGLRRHHHNGPTQGVQGTGSLRARAPHVTSQADAGDDGGGKRSRRAPRCLPTDAAQGVATAPR